jgi:acid stress chaperone HdeB
MNHLSRCSILCVLTFLLTGVAPAASVSDQIDLSSWTCKRFLDASSADANMVIAWLDGYYKHENDPPI